MHTTQKQLFVVVLVAISFTTSSLHAHLNRDASRNLREAVVPLPASLMAPTFLNTTSERYVRDYYASIKQWGSIVQPEVRPVPGHADWRYLGLPTNVENDVRPTAYAAMVLSFLAEFKPPHAEISSDDRVRMRSEAIGLLRYLTASHVTGGAACVNGKRWGNQWQSAMWARAAAMAAWQIWPHLDGDLQEAVARMVAFEADRFVSEPPKSGERNDTGAEENAWNACLLALACNMLHEHPHAADWEQAAKRYMYNSLSIAADSKDSTPGDDGRPIRDWVTTVNTHDDFTLENHGIVHVGYLALTATELQENAIHWRLVGRQPPLACQHHVPQVFDVLLNCTDWVASPIYFAGNDWKTYQSQSSDVLLYCGLNLLAYDARAAYLESVAIAEMLAHQQANKGYYNVRRDLEYGGLCATRAIFCCFAHAIDQTTTPPATADEFDRAASGVRLLPSAKTVVHRTPRKFASFSWAQKRMGLTLPQGEPAIWPHFSSYLGLIDGEDTSSRAAKLRPPKVDVTPNSFQITGTLSRLKGRLDHDFCFISPPDDYTVYIERLRPQSGFRWTGRETGIVGLEFPVGENSRILYGEFGMLEAIGHGGDSAVIKRATSWLNIDNRIGYVICREPATTNTVRYHDHIRGEGRVPHLQEWISLVGDKQADSTETSKSQWACVVTFPNQSAAETKAVAAKVRFSTQAGRGTCQIVGKSFVAHFEE